MDWLAAAGAGRRILILGPSRQAMRSLVLGTLEGPEATATFGWEQLSLPQLARALACESMAAQQLVPIQGTAVEALCARILHRAAPAQLGPLSRVAERPGLPRTLARSFDDLAMARVQPQSLPPGGLRFLYEAYRDELQAQGLSDRARTFELALEAAQGSHPLLGLPTLCLDLALPHALERALLRTLIERAPHCLCTVPKGDADIDRALEGLAELRHEQGEEPSLWDDALRRLQANLFEAEAPRGDLDDAISVLSAPGEGRECVELVRRILWEAKRSQIPFDRMAILLRSRAHYRGHLEEALRRAGIPAYFAQGSLRPDPNGRALLSLLRCRAEGLSARGFAEYLSLNVVPQVGDDGAPPQAPAAERHWVAPPVESLRQELAALEQPPVQQSSGPVSCGSLPTPRHWERLIVDAAVIGGLQRWRAQLSGLHQRLELRRRDLEREDAAQPEAPDGVDHDLQALQHLQSFALPLLEELASIPDSGTWGDFTGALSRLAKRALRDPDRVLAVLAELAPMAELGPVQLAEVQHVLRLRLSELHSPPPSEASGKLFVSEIGAARGLCFDVVCVPGVAEKLFPEKVREDPLLLDDARKQLDPTLHTSDARVAQERLLLRLAAGAATRRLIVSYPRIDLDRVRPRVPSFYALEVLRAAEGQLPGYDELMRRAEQSAAARIGWPAPTNPQDAIDTAELDLAVLRDVFKKDADRTGAGRYLLEANPHLARVLRFRARRWKPSRFLKTDGLVDPRPSAMRALAEHRLDARAYSATALQAYAACPYRFVLYALHRLRPRQPPEPLEQLGALERGNLMHEVQFRTLCALRDQELLPLSEARLQPALELLARTMARTAAELREQLCPAIDRVWNDGVERLHTDLRQWLRDCAQSEWTPSHFELSFGLPHSTSRAQDPASRTQPARLSSGLSLRGSIDVVEQRAGRLRVTDHKSGKALPQHTPVVGGGEVLQPVLYALALEDLLQQPVESGRLYYCTSRGGFESREVALDAEARDAAGLLATTVDLAISEGFLPAAPRAGACEHCDYQRVCGPYEELRVSQNKRDERLSKLTELRNRR